MAAGGGEAVAGKWERRKNGRGGAQAIQGTGCSEWQFRIRCSLISSVNPNWVIVRSRDWVISLGSDTADKERDAADREGGGTQRDKAPVYDSDGSAEVQLHDTFYNDEIFNMLTQEEQYIELLEPIPEPHQLQQNDSNVTSAVSSVEQGGGTV
ncbi:hypothetical protein Tco_0610517 [Tanacetum coccineum]